MSRASGRHVLERPRGRSRLWTATVVALASALTLGSAQAYAEPSDEQPHTMAVSLAPSGATFTSAYAPSRNYAQYDVLVATSNAYRVYLTFDTSEIHEDAAITSASLKMSVRSAATDRPGLAVRAVPSTLQPYEVTGANRPQATGARLNSTATAVPGQTLETTLATSSVTVGGPTSFEVIYEVHAAGIFFDKSGAKAPTLTLTYTTPSEPDAGSTGTATVQPTPTPTATATAQPTPTATTQPTPTQTVTAQPTPTATAQPTPTPTPTVTEQPTSTGASLPFQVAQTGEAKVFAHYFPPYQISIDNKAPESDYYARNYLSPSGESGRHAAYGGLLRDRPEGRTPISGDYRLVDMQTEVQQAAEAGVDGFFIDILSLSGSNWDRSLLLADAAEDYGHGFVVSPQLDMTTSTGRASAATIAARVAELVSKPSAYRLPDGRPVVSAFKAEAKSVDWWRSVLSELERRWLDVAFVPTFLNASESNMAAFAPISYAQGVLGTRNPCNITAAPNYAARAHGLGVKWVAPVAVQDERPNQAVYQEAANLETLRASWERAIGDGADMVQLITWNDYSENTQFAPSEAHGDAFLDVNGYYLTQFKSGSAPAITGDALYVTHRTQFVDAKQQLGTSLMRLMSSGTTSTKPRDTVEVQTFLTAAATVTVSIGSTTHTYSAPEGVYAKTFPLALGRVSVTASRSGARIATAVSQEPVVANPLVQDLQYVAVSSR